MEVETKKKILMWVAIATGVIFLGVIFWYFAFVGQFHRYRDDMYKFTIKFPKRWGYTIHPKPGGAVVFVAPRAKGEEGFSESINVTVQDLPPDITNIKELTNTVITQMKAVFENIKMLDSSPALLGGRKAWKVIFATERPDALNIVTVWTIRDAQKAYILTYMCRTVNYDKYLPLFEYMMKSFKTI